MLKASIETLNEKSNNNYQLKNEYNKIYQQQQQINDDFTLEKTEYEIDVRTLS
jgi:hypothetical protein